MFISGEVIIIYIVAFIILLALIYSVVIYNKLANLEDIIVEDWEALNTEISLRFKMVEDFKIDKTLKREYNKLKKSYEAIDQIENRMDISIELDLLLKRIDAKLENDSEWLRIHKDSDKKITKLKRIYNNDALKQNDKISRFPSNFIALIFGFKKWLYFRT